MSWGQLTRRSRESLKSISVATEAGGISASSVPGRVDRHLRSNSSKAVALRRATEFAQANKQVTLDRAANIDLFQRHRSKVRWRYEAKPFGRYRKVCDLPPRLRVAQLMAKDLVRAQHTPRDHIFDWPDRGGCPGAVARTRQLIDEGYRFLVVADIRDCHEAFNPDFIYTTNLLPPEFVRAALDSRELRYGRKGYVPNGHNTTEHARPRGLLQGGAASSSFLALALNDLPDCLQGDVLSVVQSDNIILACQSQVECSAAANALGRYLRDNPAGAFSPRLEMKWIRANMLDYQPFSAASWPNWFEQFGYSFQLNQQGQCEVGLSQANLIKAASRLQDYLGSLSHREAPHIGFDEKITELLAGFPALTGGSAAFISELLQPEYVLKLQSV